MHGLSELSLCFSPINSGKTVIVLSRACFFKKMRMRKNKINILITKLADKTDNSNEFEAPQPQKK